MRFKDRAMLLDNVDRKILEALQKDSRQTYAGIGLRLGIAHSTVYERVKRMEQQGIIKKYTAIVDVDKVGAGKITALVTIVTDPKESESVARILCKAPEVLEVYMSLSEELSILAKIVANSQEELHNFVANTIAPLVGVLRIRTSIITKKFKEAVFFNC